jgi:hypothetical protein
MSDWETFCEDVVDKLNAEFEEVMREKMALEQMVKKDLYNKCMRHIPVYRKDLFIHCQNSYRYFGGTLQRWECSEDYHDTSACLLEHIKRNPFNRDTSDPNIPKDKLITSDEEYQWEVMMEGEDEDVEEEYSHGLGNY